MIRVCVDSGAQLPNELIARFGIGVVPLTVVVNGVDYLEHLELDTDRFYEHFADPSRPPEVTTAAPSPGRFLEVWRRLVDGGADRIVSVHTGASLSGTLNAAYVAANSSPVPISLVDTGAASFIVGAAAWAAAEAACAGAGADQVATAAERTARDCGNVFIVDSLAFAKAGGRLVEGGQAERRGVPVLRLASGKLDTIGSAGSTAEAADTMAAEVFAAEEPVRAAVGASDASSFPVADHLAGLLDASPQVVEVVRYRVGPSVGAHTGPGTAGVVYWPAG